MCTTQQRWGAMHPLGTGPSYCLLRVHCQIQNQIASSVLFPGETAKRRVWGQFLSPLIKDLEKWVVHNKIKCLSNFWIKTQGKIQLGGLRTILESPETGLRENYVSWVGGPGRVEEGCFPHKKGLFSGGNSSCSGGNVWNVAHCRWVSCKIRGARPLTIL